MHDKFYLSNMEESDDEFEKLRRVISETAKNMDDWGGTLPLKWILLEHLIEINKNNGKNFINVNEMTQMANHHQINLDSDQIDIFLRIQNSIGKIVFFETIPNFIILKPQWLADAFRCFMREGDESRLHHLEDWTMFIRHGKLSKSLITKLFDSKPGSQFAGQRTNLHNIMVMLDILVEIKGSDFYIMPSKMPSVPFADFCKYTGITTSRRTSWLCLKFKFLPPAFYYHLTAWFITKYTPSNLDTDSTSLALYRGICLFDIDSNGCEKLLVTMSSDIIALQILSFSTQLKLKDTRSEVYSELKTIIKEIKDKYQLKLSLRLHFKCSTGNFGKDTRPYKFLKSNPEYYCSCHTTAHQSDAIYLPWVKNEVRFGTKCMQIFFFQFHFISDKISRLNICYKLHAM